jgi:hypothetical protein
VAGRDDEHPLARRAEVRDRGLHRTCSGRGEEQHVAFGEEDFSQARERALVDGLEVGPAMVDTGCEIAASTSGGTGVGPGVSR